MAAFDYDALQPSEPYLTGDTVARAKRTERAAARRRYRADTEPDAFETEEGAPGSNATERAATPARPGAERVRMGIVAALRASIHPFRPREDLAALPSLVTHKALWLPVLVTIASTVAVVATGGKDAVTAILFAYFVQTPAIGGVFLAGFLAPRASWLLGAIVGLVAAIGYVAVVSLVPGALAPAAPGAAAIESVAISAFLLSPVMGALFAAAAAWYRRFLTLTNPNRGRRSQPQKRVGDGRTRGSTGQKANAKADARR